jgi:hypothetical protein
MGLLNKFFILEYLNITRCLESISTPCPGAQSTTSFPPPQILITYESLLKQIKVEYRLHSCLNLTEIDLKQGIVLFLFSIFFLFLRKPQHYSHYIMTFRSVMNLYIGLVKMKLSLVSNIYSHIKTLVKIDFY